MAGTSFFWLVQIMDAAKKQKGHGDPSSDTALSLKIKLAEDLLLNSNLCIRQIAGRVGFYDTNYFTRFFKKETGYTPTDFRKNIKV